MRRAAAMTAGAAAALLAGAAPVPAYFEPGASIVSASPERREQADDSSTYTTISQDGTAVAFQTRARNLFADDDPDPPGRYRLGGVFLRDLRTGALGLVAHGDLRSETDDALVTRGAQNPSLSADGRFVAFSTAEALVPEDVNGRIDAYVRDMSRPRREAGAYDLVARRDGSEAPATSEPTPAAAPGRDPGTDVSPGAAISADGRRVVFRTIEVATDLPDRPTPDTPGYQVLVRDRAARTTTLVTGERGSPATPAGGALSGAGISADGTTVVWPGRNAAVQTRFFADEAPSDDIAFYLWRRVADGPASPARRITGATDPDDPGCPADARVTPSPTAQGPCYGPLSDIEAGTAGLDTTLPSLSADGRRVVFLTQAPPRPSDVGSTLDLFVTDMSPGVSRKAGTRELTREVLGGGAAASGTIQQASLSADGNWIAFSTFRTQFALPALRLLAAPRAFATKRELYLADLSTGGLDRVVRAAGADADDDVGALPAVSGDGRRVAFTSAAGNLFFGDANDRADAFFADRLDAPPAEPPPPEPPADEAPVQAFEPPDRPTSTRRLAVFVRRAPAGRARLLVRAPGPGRASADARGRLPDARRRAGGPRSISRAARRATKAGSLTLDLRLGRRERSALRRAKRLQAQVTVTFTPRTGDRLTRRIAVVFRAPSARRSSGG